MSTGDCVLVAGVSSGIGRAMARQLVAGGARVIAVLYPRGGKEELQREIDPVGRSLQLG